jgi:phosphatidylglycerophosphatase A
VIDTIAFVLASWFGIGLVAPVRSLLAAGSVAILYTLLPSVPLRLGMLALTVFVLIGAWASGVSYQASEVPDDGRVVIDEAAGAALMFMIARPKAIWASAALVLTFVVVDALKPWPISLSETAPGAVGVMLDDLVAGLLIGLAVLVFRAVRKRARPA